MCVALALVTPSIRQSYIKKRSSLATSCVEQRVLCIPVAEGSRLDCGLQQEGYKLQHLEARFIPEYSPLRAMLKMAETASPRGEPEES
jgi:hypothetical protein